MKVTTKFFYNCKTRDRSSVSVPKVQKFISKGFACKQVKALFLVKLYNKLFKNQKE